MNQNEMSEGEIVKKKLETSEKTSKIVVEKRHEEIKKKRDETEKKKSYKNRAMLRGQGNSPMPTKKI